MDIAIIGASGDMGRQVVNTLVRDELLLPSQRLQLVGRPRSEILLEGLASDLREAYAEAAPQIDVALDPDDVVADIIVMMAGVTPAEVEGRITSRQDLGAANHGLLKSYARAIARNGHGEEIILVVTNPVELGVAIFAEELGDRHRVIGMGAFNDSLRFRAEVAADLHVRRQLVQGFALGEHGHHIVPVWSSVRVYGVSDDDLREHIAAVRGDWPLEEFPRILNEMTRPLLEFLHEGRLREAYGFVEELPPDLRFVLRAWVTHFSGAKTTNATARSTVEFIEAILDGREQVLAGQMMLAGEFHGLHGPLGAPLLISQGIRGVVPLELTAEELKLLVQANEAVNAQLAAWRKAAP